MLTPSTMGTSCSKSHASSLKVGIGNDMAICLVLFNPARSKRILMNYFFTRSQFELQGLPVFALELVYDGRSPEVPDAFHVHASSIMFHKENLYRILESKIPSSYTKLAFLDADIFYKDLSWYRKASALLDTYDIVQGFDQAHWLDLTYTKTIMTRKSIFYMQKETWDFQFHPGFAWCMRRDWYRSVGFFDWAISGSGDTLSSAVWLKKSFPAKFQSLPLALKEAHTKYRTLCAAHPPKVFFLHGIDIYHLYHGARNNRRYAERHAMLNTPTPIEQLLTKNTDGVCEWTSVSTWNPMLVAYFENRQDDDLGEEAPNPKASS